MKKLGSIIALVFLIMAFVATSAFAFRTKGTVSTEQTGLFAYDGFAPRTQTVIKVTKGFTNFDVTPYGKVKFWFTKSADDTATTGRVRLGGFTAVSDTASPTSGDLFVRGSGQPILGFSVYSSLGTDIHIFGQ